MLNHKKCNILIVEMMFEYFFKIVEYIYAFSKIYFFFLSCVHLGQYHFPLGFVVNPTQAKWNHSIGHYRKKDKKIMYDNQYKIIKYLEKHVI